MSVGIFTLNETGIFAELSKPLTADKSAEELTGIDVALFFFVRYML